MLAEQHLFHGRCVRDHHDHDVGGPGDLRRRRDGLQAGAGQVAKAANQVIVGLNIGAVAEAFALVESAGVDPARVRQALMGGFAGSRILEVHGQRMIDEEFEPGGKITTQHKDLRQALELGALHGQDLPATRLNMQLYQRLIDEGFGALDHSALIKALRKRTPAS
jgi:3-hydroxyisobutyrate dehydrogenase-like beta-hydroxyacid dehydrogenase